MASLADRLRGIVAGRDAIRPAPLSVPRVAPDAVDVDRPAAMPAAGPLTGESCRDARTASSSRMGPGVASDCRAADILGGTWVERAEGRVLVVDRVYPREYRYGLKTVGDLIDTLFADAAAIRTLHRAWPEAVDGTGGLLFLDLETTGLAGGAGTQAFLVGCARVRAEAIHVRQFLLPGYEHERALLAEVAAWATADAGLVTFNGRTFDMPLIETRYLYHRLPFPLATAPHLDMLPPARRLWRMRSSPSAMACGAPGAYAPSVLSGAGEGESCRLSVLERDMGGVHRVGDVPGFEIPSRYFQFVRDGDARPLGGVLEHNRLDLLSLALVMARAIRLIAHGPAETAQPWEAVGLGRIHEQAGACEAAEACYVHAAEQARRIGRVPGARAEALRRLALCRRRTGRPHDAALAWEELLDAPGVPAAIRHEAREALAIHYEHRSGDLHTARRLVLDVLADDQTRTRRRAAAHRLQRLERKLRVHAEGGLMAALDAVDR